MDWRYGCRRRYTLLYWCVHLGWDKRNQHQRKSSVREMETVAVSMYCRSCSACCRKIRKVKNIKKRVNSVSVSRVLFLAKARRLPFIYYAGHPTSLAFYPPSLLLGRTTLRRWFTWTCSSQMEQPDDHPSAGGLLHHLLTLTLAGGHSLLPYPAVANCFCFRKWDVLCCPDFPLAPLLMPAADRNTVYYLFCVYFFGSSSMSRLTVENLKSLVLRYFISYLRFDFDVYCFLILRYFFSASSLLSANITKQTRLGCCCAVRYSLSCRE